MRKTAISTESGNRIRSLLAETLHSRITVFAPTIRAGGGPHATGNPLSTCTTPTCVLPRRHTIACVVSGPMMSGRGEWLQTRIISDNLVARPLLALTRNVLELSTRAARMVELSNARCDELSYQRWTEGCYFQAPAKRRFSGFLCHSPFNCTLPPVRSMVEVRRGGCWRTKKSPTN